ncbi:LysR substrate-binding domain-containing protein [Niveispirillum sp.]|uniref:LysR substrate-binding domain-containing protein n=1 Tax=Niveispirillum sp. TaxID=1917217 RepID=UPI001B5691F9|nr:LysR substrate-binding domain-containing protein [Niveispirillum sp.]MBP7339633.1 LysR family transcriptional regulator [Niveispirillum sp.]
MPPNLPTDLLRSFAVIVDAGTIQKATERIFLTQSALSLQMKRLEDLVQVPLFARDGRRLALTPAGTTLLGYARRMLVLNDEAVAALAGEDVAGPVRVGMVQDVSENLLTGVLAQFAKLHPRAQLHARVAGTAELLDMLSGDRLDIVAGFGPAGDPTALQTVPMRWLGDAEKLSDPVLSLAVLEKPCRFREVAINALDAAGQPYRVVLETPNLSTLRSAVQAGLGVTCRTVLFGGMSPIIDEGLPPLPQVSMTLATRTTGSPALESLAALIKTAVADLIPRGVEGN